MTRQRDIDINKELEKIQAEICKRDFYEFFLEFWDVLEPTQELVPNWHIKYLCEEAQIVAERVIKREPLLYNLVVNIPPGSSKSMIFSQMLPAWLWINDSSLRVILASYGDSISKKNAVRCKDLIKSDKFQKFYGHLFKVRRDIDAKGKFANDKTGWIMATSVGGSITGEHAHLLIPDDPQKVEDANSEVKREESNRWLKETLSSRKVDETIVPTILIQQRLHENDATASFVARTKKVKHICLPASDEYTIQPEHVSDNYVDGLLDPKRKSWDVLEDKKLELGTKYSGQYGQDPKPPEGNELKREWLGEYELSQMPEAFNSIPVDVFIDTGEDNKATSDPCGILLTKTYKGRIYVLDWISEALQTPDLVERVVDVYMKWCTSASRVTIESKTVGTALKHFLRDQHHISSETENPKGSKLERLRGELPKIKAGNFLLPKKASWKTKFINTLLMFPNVKHDEEVDCTSGALRNYLKPKPVRRRINILA